MAGVAQRKTFGKDKQISFRSEPMIVARLNLAAAKLATQMGYDGSPLKTGHLVNALCHWAANLPDEQLSAVAGPMIKSLEKYMAGADAQAARPRGAQGSPVPDEGKKRRLA